MFAISTMLFTASNQPMDTGTETGNQIATLFYYLSLLALAVIGGLWVKHTVGELAKKGAGKQKTDELLAGSWAHIVGIVICGGVWVVCGSVVGFLPGFLD